MPSIQSRVISEIPEGYTPLPASQQPGAVASYDPNAPNQLSPGLPPSANIAPSRGEWPLADPTDPLNMAHHPNAPTFSRQFPTVSTLTRNQVGQAQSAASGAQKSATVAQTQAAQAQATATVAQTTATTAQSTATTAQSTANTAQTTANTANSNATAAASNVNTVNNSFIGINLVVLSSLSGNTTIYVSGCQIQFPFGTVTYNSGSVDPGTYGTYYIYCDDPNYQGGAVTYKATKNFSDITSISGRIFFGGITTSATSNKNGSTGAGRVAPTVP